MRDMKGQELLRLLDQEREAILSADFSTIANLAENKLKLVEQIEKDRVSPANIQDLRHALRQNQMLLQASIEGVISANIRLKNLREVRDGLRVYNNKGQFSSVPTNHSDLTKRS